MSTSPLSQPVSREAAIRFFKTQGWKKNLVTKGKKSFVRTDKGKLIEVKDMTRHELVETTLKMQRGSEYKELFGASLEKRLEQLQSKFTRYRNHSHFRLTDAKKPYKMEYQHGKGTTGYNTEASNELVEKWSNAKPIGVPLVNIPKEEIEFYIPKDISDELLAEFNSVKEKLIIKEKVLFPVHPTNYKDFKEYNSFSKSKTELKVIADASARTFILDSVKNNTFKNIRLKMDMPQFHMSSVRPISSMDAKYACNNSAELGQIIERDPILKKYLAYYPEVGSISLLDDMTKDKGAGSAHIVRIAKPFPLTTKTKRGTPKENNKTFGIYVFSLGQTDIRDGNHKKNISLMESYLNLAEERGENLETYFIKNFLTPIYQAFWRTSLVHGHHHNMAHMQNTLFECNSVGLPTGRIIYTDLESFEEAKYLKQFRKIKSQQSLFGVSGYPLRTTNVGKTFCKSLSEEISGINSGFERQTVRAIRPLQDEFIRVMKDKNKNFDKEKFIKKTLKLQKGILKKIVKEIAPDIRKELQGDINLSMMKEYWPTRENFNLDGIVKTIIKKTKNL